VTILFTDAPEVTLSTLLLRTFNVMKFTAPEVDITSAVPLEMVAIDEQLNTPFPLTDALVEVSMVSVGTVKLPPDRPNEADAL